MTLDSLVAMRGREGKTKNRAGRGRSKPARAAANATEPPCPLAVGVVSTFPDVRLESKAARKHPAGASASPAESTLRSTAALYQKGANGASPKGAAAPAWA